MAEKVVSSTDGPAITVGQLINNPLYVPSKIIELTQGQFLDDVLLRDAGAATSSVVTYDESTPLFLDSDVEDVAEFAEIPIGAGRRGTPRLAIGVKKGKGVRISREMRDENKVDDVNRQIRQLVNTLIRGRARLVRALMLNPSVPSIPASVAWTDPNARVRHDIASAMEVVGSAVPDGGEEGEEFGFEANSIVLGSSLAPVLMDDDEFLKVYKGNLAGEDISYTGKMPNDVMGMDGLTSRFWPQDRVLVVERGTVGFRADARPLEATELYPEGGGPNGGPTESWRSDATMKRIVGLDQPKAACWITGVR